MVLLLLFRNAVEDVDGNFDEVFKYLAEQSGECKYAT
jgi:hypothetical protein